MYRGLDAEACSVAARRLDALLGDFEQALTNRRWLAGSVYSLADLAYTPYMTRLEPLSFAQMWAQRPRVADWYARLKARPSYTEVIDRYRPDTVEVLRSEGARSWPRVRSMIGGR